jgi:hypothetical protein
VYVTSLEPSHQFEISFAGQFDRHQALVRIAAGQIKQQIASPRANFEKITAHPVMVLGKHLYTTFFVVLERKFFHRLTPAVDRLKSRRKYAIGAKTQLEYRAGSIGPKSTTWADFTT